ncbi:hypothetical protein BGZ58_002990, partial [Dissophora ornata]
PPPKRTRLDTNSLMEAIEEAGLTQKAVVVDKTDQYASLSTTATALRNSAFKNEMEKLSAPPGSSTLFPLVNTEDLFVRQAYKDLYDDVSLKFQDSPGNRAEKQVVVTGTSGIGKSAFLLYFTIRLLATGSDGNPSIVIFQEVEKQISWCYYMAPWTLEELEQCRCGVERFQVVPENLMEELYDKIGGVPRYVLEKPKGVLSSDPSDIDRARKMAYARVLQAIHEVRDPQKMMQCFEQGKESLEYSSHLLHRWPTDDHHDFRLEWASAYIADEIGKSLQDVAWQQILGKLVDVGLGTAKGPIFELYVRHIFRKGGHEFRIKDLQDKTDTTFKIPANPSVELFNEISAVPPGTLCIPKSCTYACVDLLLSPRHLFQVTVSKRHDIKGPPFGNLLKNLMDSGWIRSSGDAHLVFVVPSEIYDNFPEQKYLSATGKVYKRTPHPIQLVKQFVLKIDLKSASTGKSPGIDNGPAY